MLRSGRRSAPLGPTAIAALVLLAAACAGDGASPVEPVPTVTTNAYALATLNGAPLPWTDPISGTVILGDTLWLTSTGGYTHTTVTNRGAGSGTGRWAYVSGGVSLDGAAPAAQRADGALVFTVVVGSFGATQVSVFRPVTP